MPVLNNSRRVFVAGHKGMVGSAISRLLERDNDCELILRTSDQLDLSDQAAVRGFLQESELMRSIWPLLALAESMPTIRILLTSFIKI